MYKVKNKQNITAFDDFSAQTTPLEFASPSVKSQEPIKLKSFDKDSGKDRMVDFDYEGLMAEAQRREDSGDLEGAIEMLDIAERLVHEVDYKQSSTISFKMAETLHQISNNDSSGETKQARLARLDKASDWLNISDDYKKLDKLVNKPEKSATTAKRKIRLGARAVMNTFKSTIKSTLNRHS